MANSPKIYYALVVVILMFGLTACALPRDNNENADLQPVEVLPPTLAPLGADGDQAATEASPIPTVINVQSTGTTSALQAGDAAPSPVETVAPTSEPGSIPSEPVGTSSQAEQAAVAPETFAAPSEGAGAGEPVVVDATSQETVNEPVAANPPYSETDDYGASAYGDGGAYTVQPGDTLFSLSRRYGTTVEAIAYANGLTSDLVYAGQALTIPTDDGSYYPPSSAPAMPAGGNSYLVSPGETLFSIALRYGTSVEAIASANGIPYPYVIYPGQPLIIPSQGYPGPPQPPAGYYAPNPYPPQQAPGPNYGPGPQAPQGPEGNLYYPPAGYPAPQGPEQNYPSSPEYNSAPGSGMTHTVAPGETLHSIARHYGTSADFLAQANGLADPNQLYVGQVLYLP